MICDKTLFVSTDPQKPIFCLVFLLEKSEKEEEDFEEYDGVTAASLLLYYLANQLNFHLITTSYLVDHHQIFLFVRRIIIIIFFSTT